MNNAASRMLVWSVVLSWSVFVLYAVWSVGVWVVEHVTQWIVEAL